jgi:hypothetical protein
MECNNGDERLQSRVFTSATESIIQQVDSAARLCIWKMASSSIAEEPSILNIFFNELLQENREIYSNRPLTTTAHILTYLTFKIISTENN